MRELQRKFWIVRDRNGAILEGHIRFNDAIICLLSFAPCSDCQLETITMGLPIVNNVVQYPDWVVRK